MQHETRSPTSIYPRASTRTPLLRRASLFSSLFSHRESRSPLAPHTTTDAISYPTTASCYDTGSPHLSSQPQRLSNPIARGFLQVAVSKAPAHTNVIHASSQGRFRYSPRTSGEFGLPTSTERALYGRMKSNIRKPRTLAGLSDVIPVSDHCPSLRRLVKQPADSAVLNAIA